MIGIHIGLKKCASASIQAFLCDNENALRELGIDYPTVGRIPKKAHHNIAYESYGTRKFRSDAGSLKDLAAHWNRSRCNAMILSSEMFEATTKLGARRLKTELVTDRFAIIVFTRQLRDLMPSSYAQKVKYGVNTYNFDEFFDERMEKERISYFDTVRRWAQIFGWESVHVRMIDAAMPTNGDLFDDLLSIMGMNATLSSTLQRPGRINAAPGWKVLETVRALYRGTHGLPAKHPLLSLVPQLNAAERESGFKGVGNKAMIVGDALGWNADRGLYLTRAQAQRCAKLYRVSIKALNRNLPTPLPLPDETGGSDFVERQFLPDVTQIPPDEVRDFYDRLTKYLVAKRKRTAKGDGRSS